VIYGFRALLEAFCYQLHQQVRGQRLLPVGAHTSRSLRSSSRACNVCQQIVSIHVPLQQQKSKMLNVASNSPLMSNTYQCATTMLKKSICLLKQISFMFIFAAVVLLFLIVDSFQSKMLSIRDPCPCGTPCLKTVKQQQFQSPLLKWRVLETFLRFCAKTLIVVFLTLFWCGRTLRAFRLRCKRRKVAQAVSSNSNLHAFFREGSNQSSLPFHETSPTTMTQQAVTRTTQLHINHHQ